MNIAVDQKRKILDTSFRLIRFFEKPENTFLRYIVK